MGRDRLPYPIWGPCCPHPSDILLAVSSCDLNVIKNVMDSDKEVSAPASNDTVRSSLKDGVEYLGGERDLPILSFEEIYPLQEGRSIWMLQSTIDMHIATNISIKRAIMYKGVFLRVKNVELKSANCSVMFCDRSLCHYNNRQTESKCICFPKMYSQGGQLTLCMDIEMYKARAIFTIFHPFQSLEWSKLLLGSDIQSTNSNVSEWQCEINNLQKFVDD